MSEERGNGTKHRNGSGNGNGNGNDNGDGQGWSRKNKKSPLRSGLIAALDVGTTKASCLIARPAGDGDLQIVGIGHQASHGMRRGTIVDLEAAEASIRATVEAAERMTGENIRQVFVNVSAGSPHSLMTAHEISIAGHEIGDSDLRRVLDHAAFMGQIPHDHEIVHVIPIGYSVDGTRGIFDPRGMFGQRLGVNLHVISAASGPVRNLATCVSRCHLEIAEKVVSPYASALGCLVDDEIALGVTVIDMGGGTTSIAVFFDGELIHTDSIPVGGLQVTTDIARGLSTPVAQAERIKTLFGSCMPSPSDDRQLIEVPPMGVEGTADTGHVPRSMLVNIIRPRIEEIFEIVRARLEDAGFDKVAGRRVVLTGGASQLPGAPDLAGMILDKRVRMGRPRPMAGLPEPVAGPALALAIGLLRYAAVHAAESLNGTYRPAEESVGRFGRLGQWLRENF
jgi:cell division protein FtsA